MSKQRLVITAVLAGQSQSDVARRYGVSQGWISKLMARWRLEGFGRPTLLWDAIVIDRYGVTLPPGFLGTLNNEQILPPRVRPTYFACGSVVRAKGGRRSLSGGARSRRLLASAVDDLRLRD